MANHTIKDDSDQHDPKIFRETLGSFGTTTKPGGNQLEELQVKIRQGVKHVELHLASRGKGQFNVQDVPDKYGFEQRRTIMQLAKMNQQTLSVHGTFDVVSFTGLENGGFNDAKRATEIKELDETIKFAAETAKGGAVVFHIQGDSIPTSRGELNISERYLEWLKKNKKDEYERIKKEYFNENPLNRLFVDDPDKIKEVKTKFYELDENVKKKYIEKAKEENKKPWEVYYIEESLKKQKISPDLNPLVVVGDKISQVERSQELIDIDVLLGKNGKKKLNDTEISKLKKLGINLGIGFSIEDFQKLNALITSNQMPENIKNLFENEEEFQSLKEKLLLDYSKILKENNYLQSLADKKFFEKLNETQIELMKLQKKELETKYEMYKNDLRLIRKLKAENREDLAKLKKLEKDLSPEAKAAIEAKRELISKRNEHVNILIHESIGINEYSELANYEENISKINNQIHELEDKKGNIKSLSGEVFEKNVSAIGELGIKALRYQLDMKKKSKTGPKELVKLNNKIKELEEKYNKAQTNQDKDKLNSEIQKLKYERRLKEGLRDYEDIDLVERPLYIAPENMLPGMGSLTNLEEYKGVIRMAQEEFAKRILSDNLEYKSLKEEYEKETGIKIKTLDDARELAKRHVAGTFDNAHAATWLKHFKKIEGETEEQRLDRFNKWLNDEAYKMAKEGLIKHCHFNDSAGKDDDHNLLGSGILDLHGLRENLRKAGIKEPLIVEAGGRGAESIMHVLSAFEIFNPSLIKEGYKLNQNVFSGNSGVSDWISVRREYERRPEYSSYGMSYSTFRHQKPQQGTNFGEWSGTGFL